MLRFVGPSNILRDVDALFERLDDLRGKTVVDIPAGAGRMSGVLMRLGAQVEAYDLFPEAFQVPGLVCRQANLLERLPMPDHHADIVLCQEGMEHLQDQMSVLREFSRVLKPGGRLYITTPNRSAVRAKCARLLLESHLMDKLPLTAGDAVIATSDRGTYFHHMFAIGVQKLRTLAEVAGLQLRRVHRVKVSPLSLLLGLPLYPALALVNLYAYSHTLRRKRRGPVDPGRRAAYRKTLALNLQPTVLFGKKLFLEFEKV